MNAVFIHIPKTAGIYIQEALGLELFRFPHRARNRFKQQGIVTFGHLNYRRLVRRGIVSKKFDTTAFKFAFCRNPFDRAVSHYFYVREKHPDIMSKDVSFIDFTRGLAGYGATFQPQSVYVDGVELDFLGRFEHMEEDLDKAAQVLGIRIRDLPKRNTTDHQPYSQYYCEESHQNVRDYYGVDFERFGYDKLLH